MPVRIGRGIKTRGRLVFALAYLKKCIVNGNSEYYCLAHELNIAIGRITNDPDYKSYRDRRKLGLAVQQLIVSTGINLGHGWVSENPHNFRNISKNIE